MKMPVYWLVLGIPALLASVSCSPKEPASRVNPLLGLKDVKTKTGLDLPQGSRLLMSEIATRMDSDRWIIQMSSTDHVKFPDASGSSWIFDKELARMTVKKVETEAGISIPDPVVVSNGGLWHLSSNIQCSANVIVSGQDEYIELERLAE